jgi:signal transduction histidine kinase
VTDNSVAGHLFRIAQEAANNAIKHSQASKVVISLTDTDGGLRLEISDDGKGLPKTSKPNQGIGLQVMKHRAGVIGADLEVHSQPGNGVTVVCMLRQSK